MRLALLLFFSFSVSTVIAAKLPFEIVGGVTVKNHHLKNGEDLKISEFKIKNTSDHPLRLSWTRIENSLPEGWDYSMCAYGECQIGIPRGSALKTIAIGQTGFIALHVFPKKIKGEGSVQFQVKEVGKEGAVKLTFNVKVD
jgi:hypothetical protein